MDSGPSFASEFLSTPSARRATLSSTMRSSGTLIFLSTPSARRATSSRLVSVFFIKFLSTPSARRATRDGVLARLELTISIHALREEGDSLM